MEDDSLSVRFKRLCVDVSLINELSFFLREHPVLNLNKRFGERLETMLMLALKHENYKAMELLIKRGADVNVRDSKGQTILHKIIGYKNSLNVILLLIQVGADINGADRSGLTPLMVASMWDRDVEVEILIAHGADPLLANIYNQTALDIAVGAGNDRAKNMILAAQEKLTFKKEIKDPETKLKNDAWL